MLRTGGFARIRPAAGIWGLPRMKISRTAFVLIFVTGAFVYLFGAAGILGQTVLALLLHHLFTRRRRFS